MRIQYQIAKITKNKELIETLKSEVENILNNMDFNDINLNIFLDNILKI